MNKKELIERIEGLKKIFGNKVKYIEIDAIIELVSKLDEPETGHADEAPRYLKNILARLRELPLHNREAWLKVIMSEFKQDFSNAKWREGYEQGKLEGMVERKKVKVKKFVADWYEENKDSFEFNVWDWIAFRDEAKKLENREFNNWINDSRENPIQTLVNMHQFGYEVEKEKRYRVKLKGILEANEVLNYKINEEKWVISSGVESTFYRTKHTRKQLEEAGFGWVFDCPGIQIEEVE